MEQVLQVNGNIRCLSMEQIKRSLVYGYTVIALKGCQYTIWF